MNRFIISLILFLFVTLSIYSEYSIGVTGAKNFGEHIFETGNKYPNLSGIRGGSRITYNRNFYLGGVEFNFFKDKYLIGASFFTTGWYTHTEKMSRDEDFLLGQISTERGQKFSASPLFLHDTAHTFTGTQNFADGYAKSVISQNKSDIIFKYYFGKAQSDPWKSTNGFFISTNMSHSFFKYYLYDVIQYVNRPFYHGPIGLGLSYSQTFLETVMGPGYFHNFGKLKFEASIQLSIGFIKYRDFHVQRALNFRGEGGGTGFLFQFSLFYAFSNQDLLRISYKGHRFFSESHFKTQGGLSTDDILSNYSGKFHSYINTKESSVEISFLRKISHQKELQ